MALKKEEHGNVELANKNKSSPAADEAPKTPTSGGKINWAGWLALIALVAQNTSVVILNRWTKMYSASVKENADHDAIIIAVAEALKLLTALILIFWPQTSGKGDEKVSVWKGWAAKVGALCEMKEGIKMSVPAICYVVQNRLIFLAVANIPGPMYQATFQTKTLTTAVMSWLIMGRKITMKKWFSLFLLVIGVVLVQVDGKKAMESVSGDVAYHQWVMGICAALTAALVSGFAGIYFEYTLKTGTTDLWIRNAHLAFFSYLVCWISMFFEKGEEVTSLSLKGLMKMDSQCLGVILLHCYGGLLVALIVKYADSILKALATGVAVVTTAICSQFFFPDFQFTYGFTAGASLVAYSLYLYTTP